jgi:beta-lactam-binding protein with PASTA domain
VPKPDLLRLASDYKDFIPGATPFPPITEAATDAGTGSDQGAIVVRVAEQSLVMPDFLGMPKRRVIDGCLALGIRLQSTGSGIAIQQLPAAGAMISAGEVCRVTFARGSVARLQQVTISAGSQMAQSAPGVTRPASHP